MIEASKKIGKISDDPLDNRDWFGKRGGRSLG